MRTLAEVKHEFELLKTRVSNDRDKMRSLVEEMKCIEESLDEACDNLCIAKDALDRSADALSKYQ